MRQKQRETERQREIENLCKLWFVQILQLMYYFRKTEIDRENEKQLENKRHTSKKSGNTLHINSYKFQIIISGMALFVLVVELQLSEFSLIKPLHISQVMLIFEFWCLLNIS